MKKLKLLAACLLFGLLANSQAGQINQINIVSFTVKNTLPGNIDSWISTPGALVLIAQKVPNPRMVEPRLVIQIRNGDAVICGNTPANARPVDPFDVRTFNTSDLTGFLTNCHELKEGSYTICAQFFNVDKVAISREVCKDFRVEATNIEYAPPTLITPGNDKKFSPQEVQGVVMFRWTPLVPKPKEPVTYRLKVWQLMQGQNGMQAMRSNQPIVSKDVDNITQATANGILTGPCKPPYLCDFIWNVQALNRNGKPMGNNNGSSEPYTFSVTEEKSKGPDNIFPEDKKEFALADVKKSITFKWAPFTPKPAEPVTYRMRVWQLMQGQSNEQARRNNTPVFAADIINNTEAAVTGLITGPCKPPYLCDFIWNVEATTKHAGEPQQIIGTSTATAFSVGPQYLIQLDSIKILCTATPGVYSFKYCITNPNSGTAKLITFAATSSVPAGASIATFTPPLNTTINSNSQLCITGTINAANNLSNICIGAEIQDMTNSFWKASRDTCEKVEACPCDPCRSMGVTVAGDKLTTISSSSNEVTLSGTLSGLDPNKVKKITIELVYFNITQTGDSNCAKCAENKQWGNFIPLDNTGFTGFGNGVLNGGNFGREWTWMSTMDKACPDGGTGGGTGGSNNNGKMTGCATCATTPDPANNNNNINAKNVTGEPINSIIIQPGTGIPKGNSFSLPIAVPPGSTLSCCGDKIKICIRYTWWDFCCHACDTIKCYEIERKPR